MISWKLVTELDAESAMLGLRLAVKYAAERSDLINTMLLSVEKKTCTSRLMKTLINIEDWLKTPVG